MRIALFTETFTPAVNGIVTRLERTVERLSARGDDVLLVVPDGGVKDGRHASMIRVPWIPLPMYRDVGIAVPNPDVWRRVDAFKPDVIHAVNPVVLGATGVHMARSSGVPLVASFHTHLPRYLAHYSAGLLESFAWDWLRTLHNQAVLNLCNSTPIAQELRSRGFQRVRVAWRGGVDVDLFRPERATTAMRERLGGADHGPLLLYVGRMSVEKGLERLRAPLEELPGARLAMVGDGPHRENLEKHFAGTRTRFLGRLQGKELAAAYASADVFVFPSQTDTFGLVLLEALASGCPVVAALAGGVPDIVRDARDGLLFDPADPAGLTRAVGQIAGSPSMLHTMRRSARAHAQAWSWDAAVDELRACYADATSAARERQAA